MNSRDDSPAGTRRSLEAATAPAASPGALAASVSRLMRGLNHDLKNPLGAADGYLDLLLQGIRGDLSDEQKETIVRVRALLGMAVDIVDDVVTYARAIIGELNVRITETDPNWVARMIVDEHRGRADKDGIRLELTTAEPPPQIRTDPELLGQILRQLLANALDHTPGGGRVGVRVERSGPRVELSVRDTGPGIPPEACERVFLEFERGEPPARSRATTGVGFGLPLARALTDVLQGRLHLESEMGSGSTFTLSLPLAGEAPAA